MCPRLIMHMQADGDGAAWTWRFHGELVWLSYRSRSAMCHVSIAQLHMAVGIVLDDVWEA